MLKSKISFDHIVFRNTFNDIKKLNPKKFKIGMCKISVLPERIEFTVEGITKTVPAKTEGCCDCYVPLFLFNGILNAESFVNREIVIEISEGELKIEGTLFKNPKIAIEGLYTTPEIDLPFNATDFDLLKYAGKADTEELMSFNLLGKVNKAKRLLENNIIEAQQILQWYRVSVDDLRKLIKGKLEEN